MKEQMLRKLTSAVCTLHPSGQTHSRSSLERSTIPAGIRHFLLSTLDRRATLEARGLLHRSSPWFDETDMEYAAVMEQTVQAFSGVARFPAEEWDRAVSQACEQVLEYLVAPATTMARFVALTGSESTPAIDLRRKTGYFYDYPYLGKAVDAWLTRKGQHDVSRSEFETAMLHLDSEMTASHDADQWMELLLPLSQIIGFAGIDPPGLPIALATRFFDEKRKSDLSDAISKAAKKHQADMITMTSLERLIRDALALSDPAPTSSAPANGPADNRSIPLWKRFQQPSSKGIGRSEGGQASEGTSVPKSGVRQEVDPTISAGEPLWKQFKRTDAPRVDEPNKAQKLESKHVVLGTASGRTDRYIRDLFEGNEQEFMNVMDDLAEAPDWTTASSIIADRVFRPHKVDIYSDVAVDFTNAVEARYSGTAT